MATLTSSKLSLIGLFMVVAVHSQEVIFSKDAFEPNPNDFIYQAGANVPAGTTFLRLTKTDSSGAPVIHSVGRVLYSPPVTIWEGTRQSTFETTIRFIITPSEAGAADGIAFFLAPVGTTFSGNTSGSGLGLFDLSTGTEPNIFAVEFDTFINGFDPKFRHIGIDIESRVSKNDTEFDSATGQVVIAVIRYDARTHTITVFATSGTQEASLTYVYDLRTILPQQVQVGISSSTGDPASKQGIADIRSWHFVLNDPYFQDHAHIRQVA